MSRKKRERDPRPYVGKHKELIFGCPEYAQLSSNAKVLYDLLKGKRNPNKNDGLVRLSYREILKLKYTGLRSQKTISKSFLELEKSEWIERVDKEGGLFRKAPRYRLTGKFDEYGIKK